MLKVYYFLTVAVRFDSRLFEDMWNMALVQYRDGISMLLEVKKMIKHPYFDGVLANLAEVYRRASNAVSLNATNWIILKILDEMKVFVYQRMAAIDEMLKNDRMMMGFLKLIDWLKITRI